MTHEEAKQHFRKRILVQEKGWKSLVSAQVIEISPSGLHACFDGGLMGWVYLDDVILVEVLPDSEYQIVDYKPPENIRHD